MYCGDETGSFVGEVGNYHCRFGYGGEDAPKYVSRNIRKALLSTNPYDYLKEESNNSESYQKEWETAMERLYVGQHKHPGTAPTSACPHPLLVITSGHTHTTLHNRNELVRLTEYFMETIQPPALFVAPAPMLAAFCHGRPTATIVDVGATGTRVTPVVDGLLLHQSQRRTGRGGYWLDAVSAQAMEQGQGIEVEQEYVQEYMHSFRTSGSVHVPTWFSTMPFADLKKDAKDQQPTEDGIYTLPDGQTVNLQSASGKDLCRLPELYFTKGVPFGDEQEHSYKTWCNEPIHDLIRTSLRAVGDGDMRHRLAQNIVLVGSASTGLDTRLSASVQLPAMVGKIKIVSSKSPQERCHASWIGGSILSSLGNFQQLWLSQAEYQEYGATLAVQRFPG